MTVGEGPEALDAKIKGELALWHGHPVDRHPAGMRERIASSDRE